MVVCGKRGVCMLLVLGIVLIIVGIILLAVTQIILWRKIKKFNAQWEEEQNEMS